jgi:diguanylate cyclase (GGDEF)-like protein/PAS domain S-box-containing protein
MQIHNQTFIGCADGATPGSDTGAHPEQQEPGQHALHAEIARLNKIIQALTNRTEHIRSTQGSDFTLSQAAIALENPARHPSDEMEAVLLENEKVIRSLRESEAHFRQLFERHSAVMLLIDHQSLIIVDANPAAAQFYGYPLESLRGMSVNRINAQPESEIHQQRQQAIIGEQNRFVFEHRLANGVVRAVEVHISTVDHKGKSLFFSIIHDITERKQSEELIRNLAFYDPLTQLPNRRLFSDRLGQAMAAGKRNGRYAALMMLDLDNFKSLNDKYGHGAGDLLLIEVAKRLKSCVRELDTVARFGGDEFLVVLSELSVDKADSVTQSRMVAEKICTRLADPYLLTIKRTGAGDISIKHHCTASIGVMVFIIHEESQDDILKWADVAMYQAKEAGRNLIRFYDSKL